MHTRKLLAFAFMTLALVACGAAPGESGEASATTTSQGLTIKTHTPTEVSGTFTDGVSTVSFISTPVSEGLYQARLYVGARSIEYTYNQTSSEVTYNGGGAALDAEQADAVRAFEPALTVLRDGKKDGSELTPTETTLLALATMASESKAGEIVPTFTKVLDRSWVDIGCSDMCRTLYGSSTCSQGGKTFYRQTGIDSPNCKGRCGSGCGNARSWSSDNWTMDCAEHDYHVGPLSDCADDSTLDFHFSHCTYYGEFCATNCSCLPYGSACY